MSVIRKQNHAGASADDCIQSKICWLRQFHNNQRGTTLTEFLITLPIFILVFATMLRFGQMEMIAGQVWGHAYQDAWSNILPVSESPIVPVDPTHVHANPWLAGDEATGQLVEYGVNNRSQSIEARVTDFENDTYDGLQNQGHWGESASRTDPTAEYIGFARVGRHVTANPAGIIGNSSYTRSLVDDASGTVQVDGAGSGTAAAVGAGVRYGTAYGLREFDRPIMGWNVAMSVNFNALVAPVPYTDSVQTMETARSLMLKQSHYENVFGISLSQPLSAGAGSVTAPTLEWKAE